MEERMHEGKDGVAALDAFTSVLARTEKANGAVAKLQRTRVSIWRQTRPNRSGFITLAPPGPRPPSPPGLSLSHTKTGGDGDSSGGGGRYRLALSHRCPSVLQPRQMMRQGGGLFTFFSPS